MTINILDEIEKRSNYFLPYNGIDPAYSGFKGTKDVEVLIMPERYFVNAYNKNPEIINRYQITGIYDLGECYSPFVDLKFSLYLLQKDYNSHLHTSVFNESLYIEKKPKGYDKRNTAESVYFAMPADYLDSFMYYISDLEEWVHSGIIPKDSFYANYNIIEYSKFLLSEPYAARYSKRSMLIHEKLSIEKLVSLSNLAEVIEPADDEVTAEPVTYLWSSVEFEYPLKKSYFRTGRARSTLLQKGDILLCSVSDNYLINFIPDDLPEKVYCPGLTTIVRAKEGVSPEYLYLYLQSDTGRIITGDRIRGSVVKYLRPEEISEIPIIEPKCSAKHYRTLFEEIYITQQRLDIFSDCYNTQKTDTIENLLNEELKGKALGCRNRLAKEIIEADLEEVKACYDSKAYKATLIMAGSVLEAFLIDWLSEIDRKDYFTNKIHKSNSYEEADLRNIIDMIKEIKAPAWMEAADRAHIIRKKRNLVHAKLCLKESEKIDAKLCKRVIRYLSQIINTRYP